MESWAYAFGVICAGCAGSLFFMRNYRYSDKTVNCWFCNKMSVVPYGKVNCWDCLHCEQYNGFDQDGGYNKSIPAQFCEEMNRVVYCQSEEYIEPTTTFCSRCQQNQQLKIRQLAIFEPLIEENYDIEVEQYKEKLEWVYRLCHNCQVGLDAELTKQNKTLQEKILRSKVDKSASLDETQNSTTEKDSMMRIRRNTRNYFKFFCGISALFSIVLIFYAGLHVLYLNHHIPTFLVEVTYMYHSFETNSLSLVSLAAFCVLLSKFMLRKNRLSPDKINSTESSTATSSVSASRKAAGIIASEVQRPYYDLDALDFNLCSLGTKKNPSKDSGMFSWAGSTCKVSYIQSPLRARQPLLSPAKLHLKSTGKTKLSFDIGRCKKFSLFRSNSIPSKLPEPVQSSKEMFQKLPEVKMRTASCRHNETIPKVYNTNCHNDSDLSVKLSMFNLHQSTIRPKMFGIYTSKDSLDKISSSTLFQRSEEDRTNSSKAICTVDSTTNQEQISNQLSANYTSTISNDSVLSSNQDTTWRFNLVFGVIVIAVSIGINIAIHLAWKNYLV